ncbi:methyl-accepting chemotaxis protein, partial [Pseudomonas citronellolis]|uniref:methyl-accepting chemotaxis protein n=1 Tax=Pseudomonas citronellolis TaxID=53408 RepID=UPI0023E42D9C
MPFRRLSIQWKITLLAGLCLLGVVILLAGLSIYRMQHSTALVKESSTHMLDDAAEARLRARGEIQAMRIQRYFSDAYRYTQSFARQALAVRQLAAQRGLDTLALREELNKQMRDAVAANPELLGLYLAFEPDALDGRDAQAAGQTALGSNEKGRFAQYWAQATPGQLEAEPMDEKMLADTSPGPSGAAYNAWYTCPKNGGKACVLEPYVDEVGNRKILMTSIALPLLVDGKLVGVIGVDIALDRLQEIAHEGSQELYGGKSRVAIISATGLLAGYSADAGQLSKKLQAIYPGQGEELQQLQAANEAKVLTHDAELRALQPLRPIPDAQPWGVLIDVPLEALQGPALKLQAELDQQRTQGTFIELGLGLLAALLGLLLVWLTARGVTRPILGVAGMLRDIASGEGDLTQRLKYQGHDELGELAGWFNRFLDKLQPIIRDVKSSVQDARATADQSAALSTQTSAG